MVNENLQDIHGFSAEELKSRRINSALSAGVELFLERGIEAVKMTDIAEASGIGVATLYRYFGTKTRIAVEVMTFLWSDLKGLYSGVFDAPVFRAQSGIKQLSDLMKMFVVLFETHRDFMRLLGEFDRFVISEGVPKDELAEYESSVIDFYPMLESAYAKGCEDGTVRQGVDFGLFYKTFAHALTELCKKFIGGEILPSDDFSSAKKELEMLIGTAVYYLKTADKE